MFRRFAATLAALALALVVAAPASAASTCTTPVMWWEDSPAGIAYWVPTLNATLQPSFLAVGGGGRVTIYACR